MARPTKLTPELQEKICGLIATGNWAVTACKASGVSTSTYYEWRARGEREEEGPYADFLAAVEEADATAEIAAVAVLETGMASDPKLALTLLARRFPERWGPHTEPEQKEKKPVPQSVAVQIMIDEQGRRRVVLPQTSRAAIQAVFATAKARTP